MGKRCNQFGYRKYLCFNGRWSSRGRGRRLVGNRLRGLLPYMGVVLVSEFLINGIIKLFGVNTYACHQMKSYTYPICFTIVLKTVTQFARGLLLDRPFKVLQRGVGLHHIATSKLILVCFLLWLYAQLPDLLGQLLRVEGGRRGPLLLKVLAVCSGMVRRG